jgi:hypothetical protein
MWRKVASAGEVFLLRTLNTSAVAATEVLVGIATALLILSGELPLCQFQPGIDCLVVGRVLVHAKPRLQWVGHDLRPKPTQCFRRLIARFSSDGESGLAG